MCLACPSAHATRQRPRSTGGYKKHGSSPSYTSTSALQRPECFGVVIGTSFTDTVVHLALSRTLPDVKPHSGANGSDPTNPPLPMQGGIQCSIQRSTTRPRGPRCSILICADPSGLPPSVHDREFEEKDVPREDAYLPTSTCIQYSTRPALLRRLTLKSSRAAESIPCGYVQGRSRMPLSHNPSTYVICMVPRGRGRSHTNTHEPTPSIESKRRTFYWRDWNTQRSTSAS